MKEHDDIDSVLDMIENMREKMEDLTQALQSKLIRLSFGFVTYEEAQDFWSREVKGKRDHWVDCKYCIRTFKDWLANGGVSRERWESIKPQFEKLNETYRHFERAQNDFVQKLNIDYSWRNGSSKGNEVSYERGKTDGKAESLDLLNSLLKEKRELERLLKQEKRNLNKAKQASVQDKTKIKKYSEKIKKLKEVKRELEKRTEAIMPAREFLKECRDAAKSFYEECDKNHNDSAAAGYLMEQDWFNTLIEFHDNQFRTKVGSGSAIGHREEGFKNNLRRHIARWRRAKWKLPFED